MCVYVCSNTKKKDFFAQLVRFATRISFEPTLLLIHNYPFESGFFLAFLQSKYLHRHLVIFSNQAPLF